MSIFESKSQVFLRKVREGFGRFWGKIKSGFRRFGAGFRALPQGVRTTIGVGGSILAILIIFAVFWLPMLQRTEPEPEAPRETVAEAITRIDRNTQGHVTPDMVPDLIEEIEEEVARSTNDREIVQLHILKFKVYFNAGQFYRAALVGPLIEELDFELVGTERFEVYHLLVFAHEAIGDMNERRRYAALVLREFESGAVEDTGSMQFYYCIVHTC